MNRTLRLLLLPLLYGCSAALYASASLPCAPTDSTPPATRKVEWDVSLLTEGQCRLKHTAAAWNGVVNASLAVPLWQGAKAEAGALATWHVGPQLVDVRQDFSSINAESRAARLVHAGLSQTWKCGLQVFAGLLQADEHYFNTELSGLFTNASYGCYPTLNDNLHINVYPLSSLGLHLQWDLHERLTLRTTLCNGVAADTPREQFRFRPRRDGVILLGSADYCRPSQRDDELPTHYVLGGNVGNHYRAEWGRRHTLCGLWATVEQPLCRTGRLRWNGLLTVAHEFNDPETANSYWNAALAVEHMTRKGGTLALGISRAYYTDGHETDVEATFSFPVSSWLSLQPAVHFITTDGRRSTVAMLRVSLTPFS